METLDFECPVCFSIDFEQKIIPECGHSFCTKCLNKVTNEKQLLCPECRTYCKNTDKLIKNFSINRQIENRRQSLEKFKPKTEEDHILQKQVHSLKQQLMLQQLQIQNLQQVNKLTNQYFTNKANTLQAEFENYCEKWPKHMINDYEDIFTQEIHAYVGRSGKAITWRQGNEANKIKDRLLNIRKLSPDLVSLLINNSKSENWPEFIKKKNKEQIKKLKFVEGILPCHLNREYLEDVDQSCIGYIVFFKYADWKGTHKLV